MTGIELARRVQESFPDLPVVLATGYAELADDGVGPAFPRLAKPFRQEDLAVVISDVAAPRQSARWSHSET
jgi:two-component SAPR family response regulator